MGTGRSRWGREVNEDERKRKKNNKETVLRSVKEYWYFRSSTKYILLYDMASSQSGPQSGLWLSERE